MTPEELNRTIEFIIESQGRLAAAQEQDREKHVEFQAWSREFSAQALRLLDHQSQRMDRLDKFYDDLRRQNESFQERSLKFQERSLRFQDESRDFQKQSLDLHKQSLDLQKQALHLLNLIREHLAAAP